MDERALTRSTELRLIRSWVGRGLVDALPFGSSLGRASFRAATRIDAPTWLGWSAALRVDPGLSRGRRPPGPGRPAPSGSGHIAI